MIRKQIENDQSGNMEVGKESSLWTSFLTSVRSMLRNIDSVSSLTVEQTVALTPEEIRQLGPAVRRLPLVGVRSWKEEQVSALTLDQLISLDAGPAQLLSENIGASRRRVWLLETYRQGVFRTLPHLLCNIQDAGAILALATVMELDIGPKAAKCLFMVARYGKDWQLTTLLDSFSENTFKGIVLSDVSEEYVPDPSHPELGLVHERDTLLEKRDQTERQIARAQEAIKELDSYEHTLLYVKHPQVREKVFRDFREWLAGTLFSDCDEKLVPSSELLRLSPLQQKVLLRKQLHDLKTEMQSRLDYLQAEADILWASFEELTHEWETVSQRHEKHSKLSARILSKLEDLERDLEPYIDALRDSKKHGPSIAEVDRYMQEIQQGINEAEQIEQELTKLEERLNQIQAGLDHDVTASFLKTTKATDPGEVQLFGLQIFKRMTTMSHNLSDVARQKSLRDRIEVICDKKLFNLLDGRSKLYRNIHQTMEKVYGLQLKIAGKEGDSNHPGIIERCKKRISAWNSLREQIKKLIGE